MRSRRRSSSRTASTMASSTAWRHCTSSSPMAVQSRRASASRNALPVASRSWTDELMVLPLHSMADGIPAGLHVAQQTRHFVDHLDVVADIGFHQASDHVFVETIQIGGDFAALLQVQTLAQAADDTNSLADHLAFHGLLAMLHGAFGLGQAGHAAFHEHLDQSMRTGVADLGLG